MLLLPALSQVHRPAQPTGGKWLASLPRLEARAHLLGPATVCPTILERVLGTPIVLAAVQAVAMGKRFARVKPGLARTVTQ